MNIESYLKGASRGEFQWECVESYGDGASVDEEEVELKGRYALIRRYHSNNFTAEVNLKHENYYDEKEFTSRNNARNWCERLIKKDIEKGE